MTQQIEQCEDRATTGDKLPSNGRFPQLVAHILEHAEAICAAGTSVEKHQALPIHNDLPDDLAEAAGYFADAGDVRTAERITSLERRTSDLLDDMMFVQTRVSMEGLAYVVSPKIIELFRPMLKSLERDPQDEFPPLNKRMRSAMRTLRSAHPDLLTIDAFDAPSTGNDSLSRQTACGAVTELIKAGYAHRPCGDNGGAGLTAKGLEMAARIA